MGIIIRQGFKGTVVGYVGVVIGALATLFIYPYFLPPEIIGLNRILLDSAIFISFFAQMGVPNAIIKFNAVLKENHQLKSSFTYSTIAAIIGFLFFGCLFYLLRDFFRTLFDLNAPLFVQYFPYILPLTLIFILLGIGESYSISLLRITIPRLIREVLLRVGMIVVIVAYVYFQLNLDAYILLITSIHLLCGLLLVGYIVRLFRLHHSNSAVQQPLNKSFLKKALPYMGTMLVVGIGANLVMRVDIFMISSMVGLESTGIYTIAFFMASVIEVPSRSATQIISPILSEHLTKKRFTEISSLFKRHALNQTLIGGFILLMIWVNIDFLFELMPKGELYTTGKYVVLFIGIGKLIEVTTGLNSQIIVYSNQYWTQFIFISIMAVMTIAGNYILIPLLGLTGAAIASMLSYLIVNLLGVFYLLRKMNVQPFQPRLFWILIIIGGGFLIDSLVPEFSSTIVSSVIKSSIVAVYYIGIFYYFSLSPDLKFILDTKVLDKIKNIYKRKW